MTSAIKIDSTTGYVPEFPVPGRDNDSQVFRTNFGLIKIGLETAANEISLLQAQKADLITQNFFTNTTPSVSTQTGAVVIAGGVGISKDVFIGGQLNVGGGTVITSSTAFISTSSEILISGTYSVPVLKLATNIADDHRFSGKISVASTSGAANTRLFVSTTGTSQIAGHFRAFNNDTSALKLESFGGNTSYRFIKYVIQSGGEVDVGEVRYANGQIEHAGTTAFVGSTKFVGLASFNGGIKIPTDAPASPTSPGELGQIAVDSNFFYICTGTSTWVRISLGPYQTWE
jgi:hypothetical protein